MAAVLIMIWMTTGVLLAEAYLYRQVIWVRRGHHASPDRAPLVEALAAEAGQADAQVHLAEVLEVRQVDLGEAVSVEALEEAPAVEAVPAVDKCIIEQGRKIPCFFICSIIIVLNEKCREKIFYHL